MAVKFKQTVDIVVITWNSYKYLKACLDSIENYTKDVNYRLIVVDNGSTDMTPKYLNKMAGKVFLTHRNKTNLGYPKALKIGYDLSKSDYVCLMNDDVIVSPGWLINLVKVMYENPDIGILGPVRPGANFIHPYTKELSKSVLEESKIKYKTPLNQLNHFIFGKDYLKFVRDYKKVNRAKLVRYNSLPNIVSTCCALVKRSAVEKSEGIVDTRFVKYGGDDVDLCWRLISAGYSLGTTSRSYIHHFEHVSMVRNKIDRQKLLKTNGRRLYIKWESDIKAYLKLNLDKGITKEQILQDSWLLQRLSDAVGKRFWTGV